MKSLANFLQIMQSQDFCPNYTELVSIRLATVSQEIRDISN